MKDAVEILGVPIGSYTYQEFLKELTEKLNAPGCSTVYAVNAHYLNLTYRNKEYLHSLRRADINYADGVSLLKAAKFLGRPIGDRMATWSLWPIICQLSVEKNYTMFFLGGEKGLAEEAMKKTEEKYPGIKIVGTHHGYIKMEDTSIIDTINEKKPDLLWVGMGDPFQVLWIDKYKSELDAGLALSAGGLFKFVAEKVTRASEGMQKKGFEWLYRTFQEPHLLIRYLTGLPAFGFRVLMQKFFGHRTRLQDNV